MRRAATPVALAALLLTASCGQSYEDKVEACGKAARTHDFEADPLDQGERLPECESLKEDDYDTIIIDVILKDQGWVDDEGNFNRDKLLEDQT
jgi:hypothetical protein